jgi:uncharacterized membrane protein YfcA
MTVSVTSLALAIAAFILAGTVKGVVGMGLPTIAMSLLSLAMPPVEAAALLVVPTVVTNAWQLLTGPSFTALSRRFATLMIGICFGTALGVHWLTDGSSTGVAVTLGAVLAIYGALGLASIHFRIDPAHERWLSPFVGIATGVVAGATGISVVPVVFYLNSLSLEREELIQSLGLAFTTSSLALAIGLTSENEFSLGVAGASLLALIPATMGMMLGQAVRNRLRPEVFRRWFFVGLLALGIYIAARAIGT